MIIRIVAALLVGAFSWSLVACSDNEPDDVTTVPVSGTALPTLVAGSITFSGPIDQGAARSMVDRARTQATRLGMEPTKYAIEVGLDDEQRIEVRFLHTDPRVVDGDVTFVFHEGPIPTELAD